LEKGERGDGESHSHVGDEHPTRILLFQCSDGLAYKYGWPRANGQKQGVLNYLLLSLRLSR